MGTWQFPPESGHMERPSGVYYQTMNMTEINDRLKKNDLIVIPVGSTECHGAAQPLGEDTFLVTRMAEQEEVIPLALHQFAKKYQVPCILISLHWPTVIHDFLKDKAHGGPFDAPFQHADEAEASYSLALFPEFMNMELAVDNKPAGFISPGHVDKGGEVYHSPIKGHEHVGLSGTEVLVYPEGVIGSPTLASAEKAFKGLDVMLDYLCKLIDEIMTRYPAGQLPPASKTTMRDPAELELLLKGPLNGGKHLYTVADPPWGRPG